MTKQVALDIAAMAPTLIRQNVYFPLSGQNQGGPSAGLRSRDDRDWGQLRSPPPGFDRGRAGVWWKSNRCLFTLFAVCSACVFDLGLSLPLTASSGPAEPRLPPRRRGQAFARLAVPGPSRRLWPGRRRTSDPSAARLPIVIAARQLLTSRGNCEVLSRSRQPRRCVLCPRGKLRWGHAVGKPAMLRFYFPQRRRLAEARDRRRGHSPQHRRTATGSATGRSSHRLFAEGRSSARQWC